MCLILFAHHHHPHYQLVLAANRDEFYDRPTAYLDYWPDHPQVLAGRDLKGMGTWMGITRAGRFAALTNYREPGVQIANAPSRGSLVADFLTATTSPTDYLEQVHARADQYNGFNLLVGDPSGLHYYSSRFKKSTHLPPGIYGLSNRVLDTDWPKVRRGKRRLTALSTHAGERMVDQLENLLQNQQGVAQDQLPDTGVGLAWERLLAPIFITSPNYGTRCSSILLIDDNGTVQFHERTWQTSRKRPRLLESRRFRFTIE